VDDEVFIATGAMVFNGARMGRASSVALGGAVHIAMRRYARMLARAHRDDE
jgi:carbonic anhydrase/acetyltransferase-like protein (isoleucine patch superfamily)